jgi:hypothetical protein
MKKVIKYLIINNKQTRKETMMHINKCTWICVLLAMTVIGFSQQRVLPTPAGTAITNQAFGDYKDANNNIMPQVASNIVTTIISQSAGVEISPGTDILSNLSPQSINNFPLAIINTGNGTDTFDLNAAISVPGAGDYSIEIWSDKMEMVLLMQVIL